MKNKIAIDVEYSLHNMNCKIIQLCQKFPEFLAKTDSLHLVKLHKSAMILEEYELASFIHNEITKRNEL